MSVARSSSATATTGIADPHAVPTGRFAPSPTGALHFGSLVAALGSHLDARARGGRWLVRLEDLDPPRERPGAADQILRSLERLGLEWDGPVWRQSQRSEHYEAALDRLRDAGLIRFCACSRSLLKALPQNVARASGDELYHPEQCVSGQVEQFSSSGLRLRVPHGPIAFDDRNLGRRVADVASEVGDFVLKRRDGLYAYQLAVVIDDAAQGVTDVVRGSDLLSSTARQMLLQRALGLPAVAYLHLPLAVAADGTKLSKSGDAPAFAGDAAGRPLWRALAWLGQRPPRELKAATAAEVLRWGVAHWQPRGFAGVVSRRATIAGTE